MKNSELKHGSLFSGIGGFNLGARISGIETIWDCEIEPYARKILKKHFPKSILHEDVTQLTNPEYVDIISGGFPCQDISISNNYLNKKSGNEEKKGIKGERSGLWTEMWRIIGEVRPKYIIIENSPMLIHRGLGKVINDLSNIGYVLEWQRLSAFQFGFPHFRKRFFGIAYSNKVRCKDSNSVFQKLPEIFPERTPRQINLPMSFKRFNSRSDYRNIRMYDGFSKELDKRRIEVLGNAVIPDIAHYLFECIKNHILLTNKLK